MFDDTNPRARAIGALAELFFSEFGSARNFAEIEADVIDIGHECMADALGLAIEAFDQALMAQKSTMLKVHDIRQRTLASEIGDISFSIRRYRDQYGCDVYLLADVLDLPYGCRVSPGAVDFLVSAGTQISYARSAKLLARHGSDIKPTTVMRCMRDAGALCAEQDKMAAESLYRDGVLPDAACSREEICIEADGTYFRTQGLPSGSPKRLKVKAMVAYDGKFLQGNKTRRRGCIHHALVGKPHELWSEGITATGRKYDLSRIERVHLGADGEKWCKDLERFLPKSDVTFHLDPFHVNHAIMACFSDAKLAWTVIDTVNDGDKREAIALMQAALDLGLAREKQTKRVIAYLKGDIDAIAVDGPSLGTMESENQHLYGVRMDSFPCAWSVRGASDMARPISRRESATPIPRNTRERSAGVHRRVRREQKELACYEKQGGSGRVLQSVGSGYLPPHQANTGKMATGKAYALHKGMAHLGWGV